MNLREFFFEPSEAFQIKRLMDEAQLPFEKISKINWPDRFPYCPEVSFRMAYTNQALWIHYCVTERSVLALQNVDNQPVYTDSCVEFFVLPTSNGIYYNLECNCIGTILLGVGKERKDRQHASPALLCQIQRWASLGQDPFEERHETTTWEVCLIVPATAFFLHSLTTLKGLTLSANLYKCGDHLSTPHYVSWQPISTERPDFHQPEYFKPVYCA